MRHEDMNLIAIISISVNGSINISTLYSLDLVTNEARRLEQREEYDGVFAFSCSLAKKHDVSKYQGHGAFIWYFDALW